MNGEKGEDSDDSAVCGPRTIGVSVWKDTGTKVILILRVDGLRKRRNFFSSLISTFKKPTDPSKLSTNANFSVFNLTSSGLQLSLDLRTERKKLKGNTYRLDTYSCNVRRFPTSVNADSAEFEIMEPESGNCVILMTLMKTDNLGLNWREFQSTHGTIDASEL